MKILIDTNFLVYCTKQKIDYFKEISKTISGKKEIIIFSSVFSELENLAIKARKLEDKESAELALKILKNYIKNSKLKVLETKDKADKAIIETAKKERNVIVATADRELKKLLKNKARILSIRQKKHLKLT